jgi:hypothetical protein
MSRSAVVIVAALIGLVAATVLLPNPMPHLRSHMPNMIFTHSLWTAAVP